MPSFCVIDCCKRVKQPGDPISFHKFPLGNQDINDKWIDFVNQHSKSNVKFIPSKYHSICSQHFKANDFNPSGEKTRKFLKKTAVPSISPSQNKESNDGIVIDDDPIIYECCGLCRTQSLITQLHPFDEYAFTLMRKCIPFVNFNINLMQKICVDCEAILNTFSSFIDKILVAQNSLVNEMINEVSRPKGIKTEPPQIDESFIPINLPQVQKPQKKLEILEIVDIKPLNFLPYETNALSCEVNDGYEEECQILSPPQFKVEIGEDGDNELELIRKYMQITTACQHDHSYAQDEDTSMRNVKTEYEVEEIFENVEEILETSEEIYKICCKRKFKSCRQFLLHKIAKHKMKSCKKCAKKFPTEISLMHHKKYFCSKLPKKIKIVKIVRPKPKPKNPGRFVCPICSKRFKGSKNLYQHKLSHRESNYFCNICSKLFKRKHGLRQHIKAQHEHKKTFQCPVCLHQYALRGDIKRCKHSDLRKKKKA